MEERKTCAILLTAGAGRQFAGIQPRSLYELLFRPLIRWVYDNCADAGIGEICVVPAKIADKLRQVLPEDAIIISQPGAVMEFLADRQDADVLVASGDTPFVFPDILLGALDAHRVSGSDGTVIAAAWKTPEGEEQLYTTRAGWFKGGMLYKSLKAALEQGREGAGDITAAVEEAGGRIDYWMSPDHRAALRATDRQQLALLSEFAREMVIDYLYSQDVDIPITDGVVIDPRAGVGPGSVIYPGTVIKGDTVIGRDAVLGPNSWIEESTLGDGCVINASVVLGSTLEDGVEVGPFTRVRPGSRLGAGVKLGNFVEVKNSAIGPGTKSAHLTYIGDADVGAGVNFGCGVCIANYDGKEKHRTTVGDGCFIGCNTNLVAPVALGDGAYTAAGTTVTKDVPADALCIGRSRETVLPEQAKRYRKEKN